uniref:DUF6589 domain-containing protein n=1 Tax=Amphimedon queenslandica TaxID=400682 RepID=A0A1X7VNR2_AMPQE
MSLFQFGFATSRHPEESPGASHSVPDYLPQASECGLGIEEHSTVTLFVSDLASPEPALKREKQILSPASTTVSSELPECDTSDYDDNGNTTSSTSQIYPTFKIVGDNVDKSIRPHCDVSTILPSDDDCNRLRENVTILVVRVLRKNFTFFQENVRPPHHIPHAFSMDMAQKSTVIPLGVLDKNENKNEDMKSVLIHLHQYVPVQSTTEKVSDPVTDEELDIFIDRFHYLLFGGDQLTAERATDI